MDENKKTEQVEQTSDSGKDTQGVDTTKDYLNAIKDLKANSVSRADYDKLAAENKELLQAVINGQPSQVVDVDTTKDGREIIKDLRTELYNGNTENMSNLEYAKKTLKLREEIMKQGGADPFEAGNQGASAPRDYVDGGKVASALQDMIDASGDDPIKFNAEYKRSVEPVKHVNVIDK